MSDQRKEVVEFLNKIYNLFKSYRICNALDCNITCAWDIGDAEVDDSIQDFDSFTFWMDGGSDYCDDEFNVIITDDKLYNGSNEEITFQDIKNYVSDFVVITTRPISEYLK